MLVELRLGSLAGFVAPCRQLNGIPVFLEKVVTMFAKPFLVQIFEYKSSQAYACITRLSTKAVLAMRLNLKLHVHQGD